MKRYCLLMCAALAAGFAQAPAPPPPPPPAAAAAAAPALKNGLYAIFNTSMGKITVELFEKDTPATVRNFVGLAKGTKAWSDPKTRALVHRPMYNNLVFHRVMLDGMIQSGDPTGRGDGPCSVHLNDEILPGLKFNQPGRLAMANIGRPNTGGCQWFITQAAPVPQWDGGYTIFGQVVEGQDVVKSISRAAVVPDGSLRPKDPPKLLSVTIERVGPAPAQVNTLKKTSNTVKR